MILSGKNFLRTCYVIRTLVLLPLFFATIIAKADSKTPPLVDEKYSLKADREAMDKLRQNIPEQVKKENDEKAFMDDMMTD
ncbi:MAG TPA: hypothetical protein VN132_00505, partial [Bdellovibrio sp.]|nr:hypothetical protein [Bdellovibrio sp.]